jgi:hypothetical protein
LVKHITNLQQRQGKESGKGNEVWRDVWYCPSLPALSTIALHWPSTSPTCGSSRKQSAAGQKSGIFWGVMSCLKRYDMFAVLVKHITNLRQATNNKVRRRQSAQTMV